MKSCNTILGILFSLCLLSCNMGGIRTYPRGTYDKGIALMQKYARDVFPDSLMQHFPSIKGLDTSFTLLNINENIFYSFPLVKKTRLSPLPWLYGELFQIKDKEKYRNTVDSLCGYSIRILEENDEFFSFDQFCLRDNVHDDWPVDERGAPLFLAYVDSLTIRGTIAILTYGCEESLTEQDIQKENCNGCQQQAEHGYSSGITFSDLKQEILFWSLVW